MLIEVKKYGMKDLNAKEHYALNYCLALMQPEKFAQPFHVVRLKCEKEYSLSDMKHWLEEGMLGLMEKDIIQAKRDGHREWIPQVINFQRLTLETSLIEKLKVVTEDGE